MDAFAGNAVEPVGQCGTGGKTIRVDPLGWIAVAGMEPKETQDAQIILTKARLGVADKPHAAGKRVRKSAKGVDHCASPVGIKRIHRQVTAGGILDNLGREGHHCAAAIGFDIAAEGCDFMRFTMGDHRHRAVVDAGRNHLEPCHLSDPGDAVGGCVCGQVHVFDRLGQKRVADAAADEQGAMPLGL
jgi:hypothetical protein